MRVRITVTNATIERVIGLTLSPQIPLLTNQITPGIDDGFVIFGVSRCDHRHHTQGGIVVGQTLARHINAAIFLDKLEQVIMRLENPSRAFLRFIGIAMISHQYNGRYSRMILACPVTGFFLTFLQCSNAPVDGPLQFMLERNVRLGNHGKADCDHRAQRCK